jgi:hypothetical protein
MPTSLTPPPKRTKPNAAIEARTLIPGYFLSHLTAVSSAAAEFAVISNFNVLSPATLCLAGQLHCRKG